MIDLVTKFIQWIKDMVSLTVGLPATISGWITACNSFLSWLPFNLGSIITGLLVLCVTFVIVYAIVRLVASLL